MRLQSLHHPPRLSPLTVYTFLVSHHLVNTRCLLIRVDRRIRTSRVDREKCQGWGEDRALQVGFITFMSARVQERPLLHTYYVPDPYTM